MLSAYKSQRGEIVKIDGRMNAFVVVKPNRETIFARYYARNDRNAKVCVVF
jgi:hypothetical protein